MVMVAQFALKAMGALEMGLSEDDTKPFSHGGTQPKITFWWDVDSAAKTAIKEQRKTKVQGIGCYQSGMLIITLR